VADARIELAPQFDDLEQQEQTVTLGMWTFLSTEVLFFGGLILSYTVYRITYPGAWAAGSLHTNLLLGTLNTAVLLTSSLTVALALGAAKLGNNKIAFRYLTATLFLGLVFLGLKGLEYSQHIHEGLWPGPNYDPDLPAKTQLFFYHYWVMTGLHAIHVIIGLGVVSVMMLFCARDRFTPANHNALEVTGLYWHFVDIVWVFLYPLFYLIR
jgi:cytochrome c oxidase subunit 3